MQEKTKEEMDSINPKTIEDLYNKHYSKIVYSFDVAFYDDTYVGYLKPMFIMDGYEYRFKSNDFIELIKKADKALELMAYLRVDTKSMNRIKEVAIIEHEMELENK
jgi:hypothetical protein